MTSRRADDAVATLQDALTMLARGHSNAGLLRFSPQFAVGAKNFVKSAHAGCLAMLEWHSRVYFDGLRQAVQDQSDDGTDGGPALALSRGPAQCRRQTRPDRRDAGIVGARYS